MFLSQTITGLIIKVDGLKITRRAASVTGCTTGKQRKIGHLCESNWPRYFFSSPLLFLCFFLLSFYPWKIDARSDWHNFRPGRSMSGKTRLIQSRRAVAVACNSANGFQRASRTTHLETMLSFRD